MNWLCYTYFVLLWLFFKAGGHRKLYDSFLAILVTLNYINIWYVGFHVHS